jgi:hypothetical protein
MDAKSKSAHLISSSVSKPSSLVSTTQTHLLNQPHDFKSLVDATGSRFSIKLNDNRVIRCNFSEITTCKLVSMCLEGFKYTLNKDIYYEIIQQWYIHRFSISNAAANAIINPASSSNALNSSNVKNQLNMFLYLLLNLCGCFDMAKLEQEMPFLASIHNNSSSTLNNKVKSNSTKSQFEDIMEENSEGPQHQEKEGSKRVRNESDDPDSSSGSNDQDWDFLLGDDFLCKMIENEKNLNEFSKLKSRLNNNNRKTLTDLPTSANLSDSSVKTSSLNTSIITNEYVKIPGSQFLRQKRPINLVNSPSTNLNLNSITSALATGGGILFPYLRNILYTLHLIYEECKMCRSLNASNFGEKLIQIQYLLANELNLTLYMNYYEQECPFLLRLKPSLKKNNINNNTKPTSSFAQPLPKNAPLSLLISQEPPMLNKFLLNLVKNYKDQTSTISQFPVISSVSKRTIKAIKIFAIISLVDSKLTNQLSYDEFLNQLFFKVNFSGFQQQPTNTSGNLHNASCLNQTTLLNPNSDLMNTSLTQVYAPCYTLKFNFKPGRENIHENIFSLCLEMGLCTLNEIYDYPFSVQCPILEAINWSRESPCFSWPCYAFDLIGRNDLAILKSNSDLLTAELQQQQQLNAQTAQSLSDAEQELHGKLNMFFNSNLTWL